MAHDDTNDGPDLTAAKNTGKSLWDDVVGFFDSKDHPLAAGLAAGGIDELFMKDGWKGSLLGGIIGDRLEGAGAPGWVALLGGVAGGALASSHPILGLGVALFAPVIVNMVAGLAQKYDLVQKVKDFTHTADLTPHFAT